MDNSYFKKQALIMRAVVQRVKEAKVSVAGKPVGEISAGLLIYFAVNSGDSEAIAKKMADKIINLRIFSDRQGKMNLSLKEAGGEALVVPQFTLYADTRHGHRPGFSGLADLKKALPIFQIFVNYIKAGGIAAKTGVFGAKMEVESRNDGPVTMILDY